MTSPATAERAVDNFSEELAHCEKRFAEWLHLRENPRSSTASVNEALGRYRKARDAVLADHRDWCARAVHAERLLQEEHRKRIKRYGHRPSRHDDPPSDIP